MGIFNRSTKKKSDEKLINVSDFLTEKRICFYPAGPSKQQVFGGLIATLDLPDPSAAHKAILSREDMGTTVIAPGIALPHARISGIKHIQAAIGICPSGVVDSMARQADSVKIFVLFLGSADNMREHLGFLAAVAALFQRKGFPEKLIEMKTAGEILAAIREVEKGL